MQINHIKLAATVTLVTMLVKEKVNHRKLEKEYQEQLDHNVDLFNLVLVLDKQCAYFTHLLEKNQVPCTEFDLIVLNQLM